MLLKFFGILLIVIALAANPWVLEYFFSRDHYIEPDHKVMVVVCEVVLLLLGVVCIRYLSRVFKLPAGIAKRSILLLSSLVLTLAMLEVGLRLYLAFARHDIFALKSPFFYTGGNTDDDCWYYSYLWSDTLLVPGQVMLFAQRLHQVPRPLSPHRFYAHWATSLEFDPVLGYKRKANVKIPGHETSNLGTRGLKQYSLKGRKMAFYGDSMVESNASSNDTLTSKIEKKTGIDCLNYGMGGYGLDQIYLLFERTAKQFDPSETIFLVGIHDDDLDRMLLKVRQSAKPYFTMEKSKLVLHTEHIDAVDPQRYFATYKPRFRIFLWRLLCYKIQFLREWVDERNQREADIKITELTSMVLDKFKETNVNITFVLFSDKKDQLLRKELQKRNFPVIEVDRLQKEYQAHSKIPGDQLFPEGHPSSEVNDAIADYIIKRLGLQIAMVLNE